jgi:hypothetical protein
VREILGTRLCLDRVQCAVMRGRFADEDGSTGDERTYITCFMGFEDRLLLPLTRVDVVVHPPGTSAVVLSFRFRYLAARPDRLL